MLISNWLILYTIGQFEEDKSMHVVGDNGKQQLMPWWT